ncbi:MULTISPECIES: ubiquinone anaerobic biosynthesis accessory factor UbiT [Brucella/Ochrobactrum group]|uniref:ubiquinone anaerobic biosynthesis accessory factor UbiT n=1 Tax=Brucella/Ochrobactrum group TaxID=2826938 RepID=UPI00111CE316|nr:MULTISPECIES: SCP2 sterol-binding domain-containing protein [Brucella/Ochrobactrum group]
MMKIPPAVAVSARIVPPILLAPFVSRVFFQVMRAHPELFERLGDYATKRFRFSPSDIPFAFVIEPDKPRITIVRREEPTEVDAGIEGPLVMLLALLEGKLDGDALFFSRDITVTGDMEAMLALRNALDDCNIDLPSDLGTSAGPFAPMVRGIANYVRSKALGKEANGWN